MGSFGGAGCSTIPAAAVAAATYANSSVVLYKSFAAPTCSHSRLVICGIPHKDWTDRITLGPEAPSSSLALAELHDSQGGPAINASARPANNKSMSVWTAAESLRSPDTW
eukprot:1358661-Pyramimonas_sp.AAC.1